MLMEGEEKLSFIDRAIASTGEHERKKQEFLLNLKDKIKKSPIKDIIG
jgi:hypothetical protein